MQKKDENLAVEKSCLARHTSVREAAQELGIGSNTLICRFQRKNDAAANYLKRAEPRKPEEFVEQGRAKIVASLAAKETKALVKRVLLLEDALEFMHAAPAHPPSIKTNRSRPKTGIHPGTPNFVLSDLHFGEKVTLEESLGTNEYDMAEAHKRMSKCWDNMFWLRKDMARTVACDDTALYLNGDIVSGDIHDELKETNDGGLRTQCDEAFRALYPGIIELANVTPSILHIVCIGGNHGRLTHKQHIKNGTEHSAEHLGVYDPLRRMIGDMKGKIAWHIPRGERFMLKIHDRRVSAQHGTMIKSAGGIGGVLAPMSRWTARKNDSDHYIFGHFHEADAYGKIIKNGALIGESGYTQWLGIEGGRPPEQVCFIIDPDHGVRRFERVSVT